MILMEDIIGVKEAGEILELNEGTIKNYCAQGKLPAKKVSGTWILDRKKINYLKNMIRVANARYNYEKDANMYQLSDRDRIYITDRELRAIRSGENKKIFMSDNGVNYIPVTNEKENEEFEIIGFLEKK